MERLYNCYSDKDSIILIKKVSKYYSRNITVSEGISEGIFKVVSENEFDLSEDIFNNYIILCYSKEVDILNDGYRHFYEAGLLEDYSNLIINYNEEGSLKEISITSDNVEINFYKSYTREAIKEELNYLKASITNCYFNELKESYTDKGICKLGLTYYYDGEIIDIPLRLGTEEDRQQLIAAGYYENNIAGYENQIRVNGILQHKLETFLMSIAKDQLADETELVEFLVEEIHLDLRNINWKGEIKATEDIEIFKAFKLETF